MQNVCLPLHTGSWKHAMQLSCTWMPTRARQTDTSPSSDNKDCAARFLSNLATESPEVWGMQSGLGQWKDWEC